MCGVRCIIMIAGRIFVPWSRGGLTLAATLRQWPARVLRRFCALARQRDRRDGRRAVAATARQTVARPRGRAVSRTRDGNNHNNNTNATATADTALRDPLSIRAVNARPRRLLGRRHRAEAAGGRRGRTRSLDTRTNTHRRVHKPYRLTCRPPAPAARSARTRWPHNEDYDFLFSFFSNPHFVFIFFQFFFFYIFIRLFLAVNYY